MATTKPSSSAATPPNPLVALLANKATLSSVAGTVVQLGARGLVVVSRAYLGPLAYRVTTTGANTDTTRPASSSTSKTSIGDLTPTDLAILALAVSKLAFEIGELALYNPEVDANGKLPVFTLDEQGHAPAFSLAHVIAANRWWNAHIAARNAKATSARRLVSANTVAAPSSGALLMSARTAQYAASPRFAYNDTAISTGVAMTKSTSRGCSSCGGTTRAAPSSYTAASRSTAAYARATGATTSKLAGTATSFGRAATSGCGCGCGGGATTTPSGCGCGCTPQTCGCGCGTQGQTCSCGSGLPTTRTYDSALCPTFAISCETKLALRDCMKVALCDFMRCIGDTLCPDGRFDSNVFNNDNIGKELIDCVGQLACSFVHCVPDALCGTECSSPPARDCEPCCDYAVEVLR